MNRPGPLYPSLYEINARTWLNGLSRQSGTTVTLADIDDATLDQFAERGFHWIWLLNVWQTGTASRAVSRSHPEWRAAFEKALPDLTVNDISGSGFAVAAYEVDPALGDRTTLSTLRSRLASRGIRLMLDFVPNHTALDHPWVEAHPEFYIEGDEQLLAQAPNNYCRIRTGLGTRIVANGRDPNLPGWPDTLQLNYGNSALQAAQTAELATIAESCDGVRCDMAMLLLPRIFQRTWGIDAAPFWPAAIQAVRQAHPGFTFLAEAYWDLEWELQQQGFDFCYDKRLYDRLRAADATAVRVHLAAGVDYQSRLARFLENHDEPRAAAMFPPPQHRAAAVITYLSPGLRFFHQGQLEGGRVHVPVHLSRAPTEQPDANIACFYARLLSVLESEDALRDGNWSSLPPQPAWIGNPTWSDFVCHLWRGRDDSRYLVAVNYCGHQAQCRLHLPFADMQIRRLRLVDLMGHEAYLREGGELAASGLYLDLAPWHFNVFRLDQV
jgi:glycosidase